MRATLITSLLIVATAIMGAAQRPQIRVTLPTGTQVTAMNAVSGKGEVTFSGDVAITMPGATATADRAIFREGSQTFELEGHVQLKVSPPAK